MTTREVTLPYGCPGCGSFQVETGEFEIREVRTRTFVRSLLWRLGLRTSPVKITLESQPVEKFVYPRVTISLDTTRPVQFKCPHCRSQGHYQLRVWKQSEHIHCSFDRSFAHHEVQHCPACGGKFAVFVWKPFYSEYSDDKASCRACGKQWHGGPLLGGYQWTD